MAVLACAPAAWGAAQPLAGGETRLQLNRGLVGALRQAGVNIKPLGPAKLKGRSLTLPVKAGTIDHGADSATFVQAGGLRLVSKGRRVALRGLTFNASTKSLGATVAGKRMRLAGLGGAELERVGFDARLVAKRLLLTGAAAAALNRVLDLAEVMRRDRSLGSIRGLGEPAAVPISFGSIAIGGRETTFSKLESLGARIGIWGGSEGWGREIGDPYYLFQVKTTSLPPDASAGFLEGEANDGISVQVWEESSPLRGNMLVLGPRLDLGEKEISAHVGPWPPEGGPIPMELYNPTPIATLDYSGATFQVRPKVGAFELMGIRAIANQFMADRLNERFATSAFGAGETFARITVTLHSPVND